MDSNSVTRGRGDRLPSPETSTPSTLMNFHNCVFRSAPFHAFAVRSVVDRPAASKASCDGQLPSQRIQYGGNLRIPFVRRQSDAGCSTQQETVKRRIAFGKCMKPTVAKRPEQEIPESAACRNEPFQCDCESPTTIDRIPIGLDNFSSNADSKGRSS